jgi:hypothetical protein
MQPVQTFTANGLLFDKNANANRTPAFSRIVMFFASLLNDRGHTENTIVSCYGGRGWGDSTERELNDDIASYRCFRF